MKKLLEESIIGKTTMLRGIKNVTVIKNTYSFKMKWIVFKIKVFTCKIKFHNLDHKILFLGAEYCPAGTVSWR